MDLISYVFSQTVNYPTYLTTQIQNLNLATVLDHIDTDATTSPMTITLWFQGTLSSIDQTTLDNFMSSYTDPTVSQNAINAILSALNTQSNVILIAQTRMQQVIPTLDVLSLLQLCTLLSINPNS